MIVYCSSDWHSSPHELSKSAKEFIDKAKVDADLIVGNGDLFDLMEYDWKKFVDCKAIQELKERLEGKEFVYVAGNHDPEKYVRKIIAGPNIQVKRREFEVTLMGRTYHFTHGHRWAIDWSWLRKFSDILIVVVPPLYHRWLKWQNRVSPRKLKEKEEIEKYNRKTGLIHSAASKLAEQKDKVVIVGHTHKPWFAGDWESSLMYDDGDMLDSRTYLRIEGDKVERLCLDDIRG